MKFPTREEFAAWLAEFDDHDVVGRASCQNDCPLSRCSGLLVRCLSYSDLAGSEMELLPLWASKFIGQLDYIRGTDAVTAAEALELLEKIDF